MPGTGQSSSYGWIGVGVLEERIVEDTDDVSRIVFGPPGPGFRLRKASILLFNLRDATCTSRATAEKSPLA